MLTFLKLGGSLITEKEQFETARREVLIDCLLQVKRFTEDNPQAKILLGHGSGSFGHHAAKKYKTRNGVFSQADWLGYAEVWYSARKLNNFFIEACHQCALPVVDFPVSAAAVSKNGKIENWNLKPLSQSLTNGLIPVVHGDAAVDEALGGTILSTEEIFIHLAPSLKPQRLLLAGSEKGVFADFPQKEKLISKIPAASDAAQFLEGSQAADVTGGMASKVSLMQKLVCENRGLCVRIFSGLEKDAIFHALADDEGGTLIV
ncbi:MAG: isopentenyl phosphate kinase [Anaerolineaceae bacterium]|nr:isopentenyl phosphate kinase [Anaerolineaceae bacterium]